MGSISNVSVEEVATLSRELREARFQITEKDGQLEQQGQLLRDLEQSLEEFQHLAAERENRQLLNVDNYTEIDQLRQKLDDREHKIEVLKHEFEKRKKD